MSAPGALAQDEALYLKLVRVVNLAARPFQQRVGLEHGLRLNEWRAMTILAREPGCGAGYVAEQTGLDKMSVSRALAGLEHAGRMRRVEDLRDQRRSRLYLTDQGMVLYGLLWARGKEREAELFAGVDAQELAQLSATLDKLVAAITHADAGAGGCTVPGALEATGPAPLLPG